MAPLPGSPTGPNPPGTGSMAPAAPVAPPNPMAQHPQGARVPTGLAYGQHQQLANAQHAMPLPAGGGPAGAVPAPGPPPGGPVPPDHPAVLQAAQGWTPPIQPLTRPTERPNEPVTSGVKAGPGPGPEALIAGQPAPSGNLTDFLGQLAQKTGSPALTALAQRAAASGA